ncbi:exodeoxyribonuclease III [Candidatus Riesia pediculischaeffi]|uniref:Endonuclease/exonuclease/phosphatase domain-containing protein n=1 Tax=Candidatus Riesia pediculischaeffi TaxID=428411 RepID=A0A1V0HKT1_9ENTR|nr:exodeoxyribonuclease III [Candidatus Riesia pediculischaeffi]ARC53435.1 hypothetical protein AOQ87_02110 [Candidatus Riesia pediculischaeffi]
MKFVSFNINGIRAHIHQLYAVIEKYDPDIIGLQETRVENGLFPIEKFVNFNYHIYLNGQKSRCGVALFSKKKLVDVDIKFFEKDFFEECRIISANILLKEKTIHIVNIYSPQGGYKKNKDKFEKKRRFYQDLTKYVRATIGRNENIVVMGDMNISPDEQDIGISEYHRNKWIKIGKCAFLPEERIWMQELKSSGLSDTFRKKSGETEKRFSWFDYRSNGFLRNIGLRIDLILSSKELFNICQSSGIDYSIRNMIRSSDHAPVWADFKI